MNKIMEVIKANRGIILKRGLIALGAVAGLTIVTKLLIARGITSEEIESEVTETTEDDEETDE